MAQATNTLQRLGMADADRVTHPIRKTVALRPQAPLYTAARHGPSRQEHPGPAKKSPPLIRIHPRTNKKLTLPR
ncbi:hypothetical protein LBMAG49_15180 [Planctomycetota bacterium]|nr:hypothetical protein LBMAG49_15180 [Planctomycetota bacterium]